MSNGADIATIVAAIVGAGATITASVISTRGASQRGVTRKLAVSPEGDTIIGEDQLGRQFDPARPRPKVSRSLWWGIASAIGWIIPVIGFIATITGFYYGIRDLRTPESRRLAAVGLGLCAVFFVFSLVNSIAGANAGAHGTGWWQH